MSRNDDKIKSALEIALEKAQKLGALSDEEKDRLKDEELVAAGEALAKRYLNGLPLRDVEAELAGRAEEDRRMISHHLLQHLLDRSDIGHIGRDDNILAAIQHLSGDSAIVQSIRDLHQKYESAIEKAKQENLSALEAAKRNELESMGISGSAVEPAIETSREWMQIQQDLDSHYQGQLEHIKQKSRNLTDSTHTATPPEGRENAIQ